MIELPVFPRNADYENIKMGAMVLQQPRRTLNFGVSYLYSQTYHKLEESTPEDIQEIMDYTAAKYSNEDSASTAVMCLANKYQTGRHYISKHSDKEYQVSHIHDIICWVTGASRRVIIKSKKDKVKLLELRMPQGIYIMKGDMFQICIDQCICTLTRYQRNQRHSLRSYLYLFQMV
jgi:hypothetical protein